MRLVFVLTVDWMNTAAVPPGCGLLQSCSGPYLFGAPRRGTRHGPATPGGGGICPFLSELPDRQTSTPICEKTSLPFLSFLLCLSRACLDKCSVLVYKVVQKRHFLTCDTSSPADVRFQCAPCGKRHF
jgi:hypothetical protein